MEPVSDTAPSPEAVWDTEEDDPVTYTSELQVFCDDRKFLLRDVSNVVALMADIESTQSQTINKVAMLQYKVSVFGIDQLNRLVAAIEDVSGVISVERILAQSFAKSDTN